MYHHNLAILRASSDIEVVVTDEQEVRIHKMNKKNECIGTIELDVQEISRLIEILSIASKVAIIR